MNILYLIQKNTASITADLNLPHHVTWDIKQNHNDYLVVVCCRMVGEVLVMRGHTVADKVTMEGHNNNHVVDSNHLVVDFSRHVVDFNNL